ncbi:hypothetical protein ACFLVG_03950, partial [Chloroflexota bacterium]
VIEAGCQIGYGDNFQINRREPKSLNAGITVVAKGVKVPTGIKIGRNCAIFSDTIEGEFPGPEIQSGETIRPRRKGRARKT